MKKLERYVNGQILSEQKGKFHHFYFENGAVKSVGILQNDLAEGEWKYYRKNGKLWQIGNFAHGLKVGIWKRYNFKGEITFEKNINEKKRDRF